MFLETAFVVPTAPMAAESSRRIHTSVSRIALKFRLSQFIINGCLKFLFGCLSIWIRNNASIDHQGLIQPIIGHKKPLTQSEKRILTYIEARYSQYSSYYDLVANLILGKHHDNIHDGRNVLIGVNEDVFADVVHMNLLGNQHIAKSLSQILLL